ncbi:MAG TPA: asparagine synthase (glutamine-hydrolyzing) [Thermoanaerobaculia bacterium]|nr:asparagine synthase (glutamine-hydrolyzing) [Thermoanaerobaculia bacterium]
MCGIAGKFDFSGRPVPAELIGAMCATIVHRGPDDEGIHAAPFIGLGQRRLAIIDLDRRAAAPMANEDGSVWVTFNGEIYNFATLRAELIAKGHTFRTEGDTEVLVHLYEEHGTDMVRRLRGMFAFAIWDGPRRRLFAARDRVGKKPFFYANTGRALLFGSSVHTVLADPAMSAEPNYHAIDEYLTYQYVPSPLTAFAGISKLPPAHTLVCDANGNVRVERYWEPPLAEKTSASEDEIAEELRARMREAVRLRLISDVPVGAFLSGGVDSGAVVAMMAEVTSGPVRTFSIGFDEASHNELPFAKLVAERYATEHHEIVVHPNAAEVLPHLVTHYGEPFADSSALPTYYVSKATREHVTVALSGDGGDESFAGYQNYATVQAWGRADAIPSPLRTLTSRTVTAVLDRLPYTNTTARVSRAFTMLAGTLPERFRLQSTILKPHERAAAYTDAFRARLTSKQGSPIELEWNEQMDALDWMMRHDQHFYLADCLMVKTDVASMANSLEVRCPLLDQELVEFAATIPSRMKRTPLGGKEIFKRAVRDLLPPQILTKPKTGFAMPVASWFRGELAPLLEAYLLDDRARKRGLFDPSFVRRLVTEHVAGRRDWSSRLWALLCLEMWFRQFID